jgi:hypothetical protein
MQIPHRRPTRFWSDPCHVIWHTLPGACEPLRTVCMLGGGGTLAITLKIFGATHCGEQWRCIGIWLYSTSKHHLFQTRWYPHYVILPGFGARHLVQKAILLHIQLPIFVWDSARLKLKILIRQGRSVNWRPLHPLSKHKSCSQGICIFVRFHSWTFWNFCMRLGETKLTGGDHDAKLKFMSCI